MKQKCINWSIGTKIGPKSKIEQNNKHYEMEINKYMRNKQAELNKLNEHNNTHGNNHATENTKSEMVMKTK